MLDDLVRAIFTMHDKFERVSALHDIHEELTDEAFWSLFRRVWRESESLFLHGVEIRNMLTLARIQSPARFMAMSAEELDFIKRAARRDAPLKVYRGGSALNHTGFSWTTKRARAEQFANLSGSHQPTVTVGRLPVPNVLLFLSDENEVIAFPEMVEVDRIDDHHPPSEADIKLRRFQIVAQAKGPHALENLTPAEYFHKRIKDGAITKEAIVTHLRKSEEFLEPLGFTTRLATIRETLAGLEDG
ncbi:hypothetical protein KEU06_08920 [Pseudaminobacter sp. 19-2017]|uniref:Uncharacterized protein n=1 Tax=Pseudaminobacter soli (ex Zhang et al. 2022) TaxID=2831468 RepID=A0A942DWM8_9HYPH|nr:hypothetical protein [Pseudaminobacter soli]MBS3648749.1 hypothetical protein [Pseudaminobacter soli]